MADVFAVVDGEWVVAEIQGTRRLKKELRAALLADQLLYDPELHLWRVRATSWPAALTVFWTHQASVEYGVPSPYRPPSSAIAVGRGSAPISPG